MLASHRADARTPAVRDAPRRLLHVFPTFAVGGSQSRFAQLVRSWGGRYHHSIVSLDGAFGMAAKLSPTAPIAYLPSPDRGRPTPLDIKQAIDIIDKNRTDVLITYNWGSFNWWVAKRFRPMLHHVHIEDGFGPEERETLLLRRCVARRLILRDRMTATVLPSQTLYRIAQDEWSLPLDRLHYIPNGIEWDRFGAERKKQHAGHRVTIGTVATLRREKNIPRLIALFNKAMILRPSMNLALHIVGGGDQFSHIQQLALESPFSNRITLSGPTNAPQEALRNMDIFAMTSDTEQMPLSVLEAMAASLPIVSFDVGDISSMVSPENRYATSIGRTDDLRFVDMLIELADNEELRLALGEANCSIVKTQFDATKMADAYAALLD